MSIETSAGVRTASRLWAGTPSAGCARGPRGGDELAGAEGFEPPTGGFGGRCSDRTELRPCAPRVYQSPPGAPNRRPLPTAKLVRMTVPGESVPTSGASARSSPLLSPQCPLPLSFPFACVPEREPEGGVPQLLRTFGAAVRDGREHHVVFARSSQHVTGVLEGPQGRAFFPGAKTYGTLHYPADHPPLDRGCRRLRP